MHLSSIQLHSDLYPTLEPYPFNLPLMQDTPSLEFTTPVTFFMGENGAGKSTLLEAIARRCGIHMWRNEAGTRYEMNPHEEQLHNFMTVKWNKGPVPGSFFGADTFRHFRRSLDEWAAADPGMLEYFGGKSLVTQSHGQSMMAYFRSRYAIRGLYLMDEPETALSPRNLVALTGLLAEMGRAGHAQFIVATHSPILLACPGARILAFDEVPVRETNYRDTDYYLLYRSFLEDPEGYLAEG